MKYHKLIHSCRTRHILLNTKILKELIINTPRIFAIFQNSLNKNH